MRAVSDTDDVEALVRGNLKHVMRYLKMLPGAAPFGRTSGVDGKSRDRGRRAGRHFLSLVKRGTYVEAGAEDRLRHRLFRQDGAGSARPGGRRGAVHLRASYDEERCNYRGHRRHRFQRAMNAHCKFVIDSARPKPMRWKFLILIAASASAFPAAAADDFTLYDLLPPDTHSFAILYDVTVTTEGAHYFFNPDSSRLDGDQRTRDRARHRPRFEI